MHHSQTCISIHRSQAKIIKNHERELFDSIEQFYERTHEFCQVDTLHKSVLSEVNGLDTEQKCLPTDCAGEIAFPTTGGTRDQYIFCPADVAAISQCGELLVGEIAFCSLLALGLSNRWITWLVAGPIRSAVLMKCLASHTIDSL